MLSTDVLESSTAEGERAVQCGAAVGSAIEAADEQVQPMGRWCADQPLLSILVRMPGALMDVWRVTSSETCG